jgi:hypothetical protein
VTDAHKKLVETCRRDAANEASLMWSLLFVLFFVLVLLSKVPSIFQQWNIHPYVTSAVAGGVVSGLVSRIYFVNAARTIARARDEYNRIMEQTRKRTRRRHLDVLKNKARENQPNDGDS